MYMSQGNGLILHRRLRKPPDKVDENLEHKKLNKAFVSLSIISGGSSGTYGDSRHTNSRCSTEIPYSVHIPIYYLLQPEWRKVEPVPREHQ